MTERIDLDELDAGESEEDAPNPGDWFWREEGDPDDAPEAVTDVKTAATTNGETTGPTDPESEAAADAEQSSPTSGPIPRVPRENEDKPAGIPMESGGAGAGADAGADAGAGASASEEPTTSETEVTTSETEQTATETEPTTSETEQTTTETEGPTASGPHGGGADDMTLAFTYDAATRFADFGRVAADATGWADWLGIVGDVPAHVLNKFQRDRNVDLDFFNGSARGPGERLADIDHHSMFFSERMVVVGIEGEDEEIAERADWEFVPLAQAAEKAGWDVEPDSTE